MQLVKEKYATAGGTTIRSFLNITFIRYQRAITINRNVKSSNGNASGSRTSH